MIYFSKMNLLLVVLFNTYNIKMYRLKILNKFICISVDPVVPLLQMGQLGQLKLWKYLSILKAPIQYLHS